MSLAFLDDNRDSPAEFPVTFLDDARLSVERRIETAANVEERYARFR